MENYFDDAKTRVENTPELKESADTLLVAYDGDDHYKWIATADTADIMGWLYDLGVV